MSVPTPPYHPRLHAAARTDDYLFAQLIPYLGNKRRLLPLIAEAVALTGLTAGTFADLFAGSGVVSRWARAQGFRVVCDDWEPYAAALNGCFVGLNAPPRLPPSVFDSNTSGLFKAYHHGWGGRTGTALYRILSDLTLAPPILWDNGRGNRVTQMDAQALADGWGALIGPPPDIVYLDPPYNQHPYGSNYHLLNTLALWDRPDVPPFGPGSKSAIRTDWRRERRSAFNHAAGALAALCQLVDALPARWVLLSYSTDGNIPTGDLLCAFARRGATWLLPRRYKRYRVSAPRMSPRSHTVEFVLVLDKSSAAQPGRTDAHQAQLAEVQAE